MINQGAQLKVGGATALEPLDPAKAKAWLKDLRDRAAEGGLDRLTAFLEDGSHDEVRRLSAVLDLSSYLNSIMLRRPAWIDRLFDIDAGERIGAIIRELRTLPGETASESALMKQLREAKLEASLLIALRDLFGMASGAETTAHLSDLAEAAVGAALRFCLLDLHRSGKLVLPVPEDPEKDCGLFVLGMGKLGAGELNYSSDVDLIVFFDPDAGAVPDPADSIEIFSRLVRRLVRMIGDRTADGYVFRTDLRLRPDPGAMPLAIPIETALTYYEGSGRNWERAAMIKARTIAGDAAAGKAFLDELTPFVWRKYLDFAAIAEIQAMKDRIDRHRGFDCVAVGGHNVKLGRGGIREVEFFAQTQQLIAAGRAPELRLKRTEEALAALAEGGWISAEAANELTEAYWFLRRVEHCIQMVADEQSHTLPEGGDDLLRIARLAGFEATEGFSEALLTRLAMIDGRFSRLFTGRGGDREQSADRRELSAVLAGEDESEAIERLAEFGFARPEDIARVVRGWSYGRYRATRSPAAREHLSRVLPSLLQAFANARDPDAAIAAFDKFVEGLPSGLQFFSLIASNPRILELLALIITSAPHLAETIAHRPHVFDALLDPAFYSEVPDRSLMQERLDSFLADADDYEEVLARLRIFSSEQRFLVGARLLSGAVEGEEAGPAFSDIADVVIEKALAAVQSVFAEQHGRVPGARVALLGMGRLGSRELTASSDVDLILLYDHNEGAEVSDGGRPLAPALYFARLTQRLIAALTSRMREGVLYEVDFRLRPSGNKGPLATHIDAFRKYQCLDAWTWERMALTRSRPIAGDPSLVAEVEATIRDVLLERKDDPDIGRDVASMRERIERDKAAKGPLDLKLMPGGLIDLEFLAQWSILTGLVAPKRIGTPTAGILGEAEATPDLQERNLPVSLRSSMLSYTRIVQLIRLGPEGVSAAGQLPQGLGERIAKALELDGSSGIEAAVGDMAAAVREAFRALLPLEPHVAEEAPVAGLHRERDAKGK